MAAQLSPLNLQTHSARSISPDQFQSPHSRWRALTHRTPSSHSSFLYGVKSTKIYCRPTCSARLARRANVVFYDTEEQAQRDGFRPCKRCQPDNASFLGEREEVVTKVLALLRTKRNDSMMRLSLKELAKEVGVTPSYLCRVFKKTMGVTIGAYMKEFERTTSDIETKRSVHPGAAGPCVVDPATGLLTPAKTADSPMALLEGPKGELAEQQLGIPAETLDLDFDFDNWFLTGGFNQEDFWNEVPLNGCFLNEELSNNSVHEWAIKGA